ncbi:hypothetical protein DFJ77DRAFT_441770 [Powellomyces hirtus]|nr:hypothetical protein DFJ77DRAFT_441770 [Powellomyces hirtus]
MPAHAIEDLEDAMFTGAQIYGKISRIEMDSLIADTAPIIHWISDGFLKVLQARTCKHVWQHTSNLTRIGSGKVTGHAYLDLESGIQHSQLHNMQFSIIHSLGRPMFIGIPGLKEYKTKLDLEFDVLEYKSKTDGPRKKTPLKTVFGHFTTHGGYHYSSVRIPAYVAEEEAYLPAHHITHLVTGSESMQNGGIWCPKQLVKLNWNGTWLTPMANLTSEGKKLRKVGWIDSKDRKFVLEPVPEVYHTKPNSLNDWLMQQALFMAQCSSRSGSQNTEPRLQETVFIIDNDGKAYKTCREQTGPDHTNDTTHQ